MVAIVRFNNGALGTLHSSRWATGHANTVALRVYGDKGGLDINLDRYTPEQARRLAALTKGRPFKINLIPFNEWRGCPLRRPGERALERFIRLLLPEAPAITVRRSQGADIGAACGQLKADRIDYGL